MSHKHLFVTTLSLACALGAAAAEPTFYSAPQLFSTAPSVERSVNTIERFGPAGMSIELHQPAFVMKVGAIEEGSPAAATGKLKAGQIIETINGQKLKDIDPRIQLGGIIEQAEATDGALKLMVKDTAAAAAQEIVIQIPVLGAYSKTWPLNCPKSDKIVRNFADYLAKPGSNKGFSDFGMLFLLSTGEDKDLAPVREWAQGLAKKPAPPAAWTLGFGGIPLCEYYLRTGDPEALSTINRWVTAAAKGEYLDAWAGRGGVTSITYGNGHLNAGGTAVVSFLMLAKECGAEVDDSLLNRTLVHFFRFAGRGVNPYGDDRPETSFVDNGKTGNLAFAMAAAASLTPEGEDSLYAKARDVSAMQGFYTTTFMLHGHTGGGIGEVWRSAAMGLLHNKRPKQYRQFMDHRKWHYELSRRYDGSFGILGGAGYDKVEWGGCYSMAYTIPRKTLRITGAAPSKFAKPYQLPKRPWGTAADDAFLSMDAAADKDGKRQDLTGETLPADSSKPLIERLTKMGEVSDDVLRRYVHHQDYLVRNMVTNNAAGLTFSYMFPKPEAKVRPALLEEFCRSKDPRVRNAGLRAAVAAFDPSADWAQRIFAYAAERLADSEESWWVKDAALSVIAKGTPDMVAPHVDLLLPYLKHQEQWLQNGALNALAVVIIDPRCYQKVMPAVGEVLRTCQRNSTTSGPLRAIRAKFLEAGPEVAKLAIQTLEASYTNYAGIKTWAGGQNIVSVYNAHVEVIATALADVPGGYDALYLSAKKRFPTDPLPHDKIFLKADTDKFGADLKTAITPLIRDQVIYEYIGKNLRKLQAEPEAPGKGVLQKGSVNDAYDELISLYNKVGVHDYDWRQFGPDLKNSKWDYLSFDPPEEQKYDKSPWRYRTVTYPKGMEKWFSPDFNPSSAGWKSGLPPFGQYQGQLVSNKSGADAKPDTIWDTTPRTLWEKEVLLVRGTFEFPALKPGHRYRVRIGSGQGVGAGDGFKVYINGKPLVEDQLGLGKREGNKARGGFITKEFVGDFSKGPVTIAATTFLRYGNRAIVTMPPIPQGIFSVWLEEMKLPTIDAEALRKSALVIPMLSAEWQEKQNPENAELQSEDDLFHYKGDFVADPKLLGAWTTVAVVPNIEGFTPDKRADIKGAAFKTITFQDQGRTDSDTYIWSGATLMDLSHYQALKMRIQPVAGTDYLFVETGGFATKNPPGWKPQLMVLKRAAK